MMWVGSIQSAECLIRGKTDLSPKEERILLPVFGLELQYQIRPWVSSLPAHPADFGLITLYNHVRQFLKISQSLSHSLFVSVQMSY